MIPDAGEDTRFDGNESTTAVTLNNLNLDHLKPNASRVFRTLVRDRETRMTAVCWQDN